MAKGPQWTTRPSLLGRAAHGEGDEFAALYRCVAYGMARKRGLDHNDAEDIAQQTIIDLWELLPSFHYDRSRGRFRGLVKTIVVRRITDQFRKRMPTAPQEELDSQVVGEDQLDSLFERQWEKVHWRAALDMVRTQVHPSTFQSFQLYCLSEWPIEKVTQALGLTSDQVYQNKRRVFLKLREYFVKLQE